MYTIKASYQTGDSFGSYDTESLLGYSVSSLETAKLALRYLREHYGECEKVVPKPPRSNVWFDGYDDVDSDMWQYVIKLPLDDGTLVRVSLPYSGYFEQLQKLEVIAERNDLVWEP